MSQALILAGTNLPEQETHLVNAVRMIADENTTVVHESGNYTSPPWGFESENNFLNKALIVETRLTAEELMQKLLAIEKFMGRNREMADRYSDRIIDLDILLYEDLVTNTELLVLPHPRMHLRRFALMPSAEIAGKWKHPILERTIDELLRSCNDNAEVSLKR